jgi:hypothetical protein
MLTQTRERSTLEVIRDWESFRQTRAVVDPEIQSKILTAIRTGNLDLFKRVATAADFPNVLGQVVERQIIGEYASTPRVMRQVVQVNDMVPDFNTVEAIPINGLDDRAQVVGENEPYLGGELTQGTPHTYRLQKRGKKFLISWEGSLADRLRMLATLPERMVRACLRSEEWFLTNLFFDADGPREEYFENNGGLTTLSTLPLTVENFETAVEQHLEYEDTNGEPVTADSKYLIVCPALKIKAMNILNSHSLDFTLDTTGSGDGVPIANPGGNALKDLNIVLLVNPWIPNIATSGTLGKTSWALFTDPREIPAGEFGLLAGQTGPTVWMRKPDAVAVTGGGINEFSGSFDTDSIEYRVRYAFGGATLDGRAGWASTGQG